MKLALRDFIITIACLELVSGVNADRQIKKSFGSETNKRFTSFANRYNKVFTIAKLSTKEI